MRNGHAILKFCSINLIVTPPLVSYADGDIEAYGHEQSERAARKWRETKVAIEGRGRCFPKGLSK